VPIIVIALHCITNMEVTSLLQGWQKYEIAAELMSKMFYFHSVFIPIIPKTLKTNFKTSKAQLAAHLQLYAARNKLLQCCRTPVVMIIIMNSSARITGGWRIPHCGFFGALVSNSCVSNSI